MIQSHYDKYPTITVPHSSHSAVENWDACAECLTTAIATRSAARKVITIDCYPGVHEEEIVQELSCRLKPVLVIRTASALLSVSEINALVEPFLGGDDPVFGYMNGLTLPQFFDADKVQKIRQQIASTSSGLILIVGCGAHLMDEKGLLVYADLARWEAQNRFRRHETGNLGADNSKTQASLLYKRAFFIDWRVADRWKRPLIKKWDFVLDTHIPGHPKLVEGEAVRRGFKQAVNQPFRVVPFFDPAPWGGQWMKEVCGLDREKQNYGWCFDCVPEENSLLLKFGAVRMELPSIDLVFDQPRALLGDAVHGRFGDEFPIRFDFLDTMGGGNLSFQVHPLTEYIQHHFGMHYTQDESYYILDAGKDATVYLGLKEGISPEAMIRDLERAQKENILFPAEKYANRWPAKKHDHFLIPGGTVHCSGANSMVLEISATPYIFTFKMWDWGRLGLDGRPRPIHLKHGVSNIQWDRTTRWVEENLVNHFNAIQSGDGWREESTGLHSREFIETRRHWFTRKTPHDTQGGVNVLNLVEGDAAIIESPDATFEPYEVHYAETFIVPANVGRYTIRPAHGESACATIKAYVR